LICINVAGRKFSEHSSGSPVEALPRPMRNLDDQARGGVMEREDSQIKTLMEQLQRQRDELRLKLHLGKAEARDAWEELERKWEHLRARSEPMREALSESSKEVGKEVGKAAHDLAEEIRNGYERLRKLL
jgi:predicted  nucleic acid-binding Zn-ribbon protein